MPQTRSRAQMVSAGCSRGYRRRKGRVGGRDDHSDYMRKLLNSDLGELVDELYQSELWVTNPRNQFQLTVTKRKLY